jgi:hypothetical protein
MRTNSPNFPSPLALDRGSKSWIKKYIRACWDDWNSINSQSFYNGRERYNNIKKYMIGRQDMEKYFKMLDVDSANLDESWLKAVKEPLPIVAKFARMTKSTLVKNTYGINLSAIDPVSIEEKNDYYARNRTKIELRQMLSEDGVPPDYVEAPDQDFKTVKELDIYMKYAYKSIYEIKAEQLLAVIMNNCGHDSIRLMNIEQLHDYGFVGYKDYVDINGDIKERFVDVRNVIVSRCKNNDFSDSFYRGEVLDYTIADVKQLDTKREITNEQYAEIFKSRGTEYSYNAFDKNSVDPYQYENERVKVLDIEFDGVEKYVVQFGKDKYGNQTKTKRVRSLYEIDKGAEYEEFEYKVKYSGKWIIGTDLYFCCGLQTDMKRPKNNIGDVQSCFHFFAPQLQDMETRSMAENYIPVVDIVQIAFMKYQDVIVSAKKKGILIDINALENVPIGKGGEAASPMDQYLFYKRTGSLIYRSIKEDGTRSSALPITELNNGLGEEASRYFNEIQNGIGLFQQISGYNEITDGSTPGERTLKAVAERASESTNNSIEYMARAERKCFESLATSLLLRIQDAAEEGRLDNYINAIGEESISFFKVGANYTTRELGIEIKDEPTDAQYQRLQEKVALAIQGGQINLADSFVVENVKNLKQAEAVLAFKIEENLKRQQEIAMQNQQMASQSQIESAQAASQVKLQEEQLKHQLELEKLKEQERIDAALMDKKYGYELQLKEMEVLGRIEQSDKQAKAKIYSSDKSSETIKEKTATETQKSLLESAIKAETTEK